MADKRRRKNEVKPSKSSISLLCSKLPSSVRNLINAKGVIDLSTASDFYKKKAAIAVLLKGFVEQLPNFQYRLGNGFDSYYLGTLPLFRWETSREPANYLAEALFLLGRQWALIDYGKLPIGTSTLINQILLETWKSVDGEWKTFCDSASPIGETWLYTLDQDCILTPSDSDPRQAELRVAFGRDRQTPPVMTIQITGEAAVTFMKLWMSLHQDPSSTSGVPTNCARRPEHFWIP